MRHKRVQRLLYPLLVLLLLAAGVVVATNLDDPGVEALPDRPTARPTPAAVPSVLPRPPLPNLERPPLDATATNLPIPFPTQTPVPGAPTAPPPSIPQPPSAPFTRFESEDWAISFEYPSAWSFEEHRGTSSDVSGFITIANIQSNSEPAYDSRLQWMKFEIFEWPPTSGLTPTAADRVGELTTSPRPFVVAASVIGLPGGVSALEVIARTEFAPELGDTVTVEFYLGQVRYSIVAYGSNSPFFERARRILIDSLVVTGK
jgi:hypothetical protein